MLLCPPQMWTSPNSTSESPNFSPVEHVKLNMCAVIDAGWAGSTWRHTWILKERESVCVWGGGGVNTWCEVEVESNTKTTATE
jgi:hypothetical protein